MMTIEDFLNKTPDALKSASEALARTRGTLDNWLVTLATTFLALPTLLGRDIVFRSLCLWRLFVLADGLLLLSAALVLVRSEIYLARVNRRAAVLGDMASTLTDPEQRKKGVPDLEKMWRERLHSAGRLQSVEPWLSIAALASFLAGVLLLSIILVAQSKPSQVITSANNRLQATVGVLGGGGPARWAFAHRA